MIDFLMISTRSTKRGVIEIYPKFVIKKSTDLMIRGGDFYAIWVAERGLWSTDEQDALQLIDTELDKYAKENRNKFDSSIKILYMWDAESGMIDSWHKYCQKQMRDSFNMLDEKIIFSNAETNKKDYASKKLSYPLEAGDMSSYDRLISVLYNEEERNKIEWAIGSIVAGESKKLQKFMVLYGSAGTGKSTILNIIQQLFDGYYSVFDAKALGSSSNSFALEAFKTNPLVAIQHDGDLSKIEDNTRLNSLVSHEMMTVNEKFKSSYANRFKCFLFMGTNKPVKITDAKSGLIRRLIDVSPSGEKLSAKEYKTLVGRIDFELGAIAHHCQTAYLSNPSKYDDYVPLTMLGASNDFYNFVMDSYPVFKNEDGVTLKASWEMYKTYCEDAKVSFPFSQRIFKEELKNYFKEYKERYNSEDGARVRSYYSGFRKDKFEQNILPVAKDVDKKEGIRFESIPSIFDTECQGCLAQYANANETPFDKWENVSRTLKDIDTTKTHYVKVPENHIVIDFDIVGDDGKKDFNKNLDEANKWPPTYAELSKSGAGIHLHYIYNGDPTRLERVYADHIEIKVFVGNSSLRRRLSKCNDLPIACINSGLPMKGEKPMIDFEIVTSEKALRSRIERNIRKEFHPGTKPSIDFIYKILEDAYNSGSVYDLTDMQQEVLSFAANSTNKAEYCIKLVSQMKFKSEEKFDSKPVVADHLVFFDTEVFPNLFILNWKYRGKGQPIVRMINPTASQIEELSRLPLVGFNCLRYDNLIVYARMIGYTLYELYELSQKIIKNEAPRSFRESKNISYTDIYDFASAGNKKSLKKLEIEMGMHHQELGLPWDKPVPEELWPKVSAYCDNDVLATEASFDYLSADWTARQILADLAGMIVNDTTNNLTTRIIFGNNRNPQSQFNYRNLSKPVYTLPQDELAFLKEVAPQMMAQRHGPDKSLLPYFPGYEFKCGKSTYRGVEVGEGGLVIAETGVHVNVALLDVTSMHPFSMILEILFGVEFTRRFKEIVDGRVDIKHEAWDTVNKILDGKLTKYIQKVFDGEMTVDDLANGLKTAINSTYGLTSAKFDNAFRDKRNVDNIVAKRGALFMMDLRHAVMEQGFVVAHIKTDSIKIPNATPEIIKFVMDFGLRYGYSFEHEATYDRLCLVNDAVYIARHTSSEKCEEMYGYVPKKNKKNSRKWTATGTQFAVPYVFKTLFSKDNIEPSDLCETKSTTTALYLDMNERLTDVSGEEKELAKYRKNGIENERTVELESLISAGHDYHFIGRVGQFCPIADGKGGGILYREKDGKYYAAGGSKGYRWLESEMVQNLDKWGDVDHSYYKELVSDAVDSIGEYCDFEWFVSDEDSPDEDCGELFNVR
ncbi:MAG: DUF5906 domain-containing protein [Bacteroides sp.]